MLRKKGARSREYPHSWGQKKRDRKARAWRERSMLRRGRGEPGLGHNGGMLAVFREAVLRLWCRTLRRPSNRRRVTWARMYRLAGRWLPMSPHSPSLPCGTAMRHYRRQEPSALARIIPEDLTTSRTIRPLGFDFGLYSPPLRANLEPVPSTVSKPTRKDFPFVVGAYSRIPGDS
jgi:hypothetical protein